MLSLKAAEGEAPPLLAAELTIMLFELSAIGASTREERVEQHEGLGRQIGTRANGATGPASPRRICRQKFTNLTLNQCDRVRPSKWQPEAHESPSMLRADVQPRKSRHHRTTGAPYPDSLFFCSFNQATSCVLVAAVQALALCPELQALPHGPLRQTLRPMNGCHDFDIDLHASTSSPEEVGVAADGQARLTLAVWQQEGRAEVGGQYLRMMQGKTCFQ